MLSHHNKHWFRGPIGGTCLSTCLRLLQYLLEITPVLGRDYCSTCRRLLQYLGQVLSHTISILLAKLCLLAFHNYIVLKKRQWAWMIQVGRCPPCPVLQRPKYTAPPPTPPRWRGCYSLPSPTGRGKPRKRCGGGAFMANNPSLTEPYR